MSTSYNRVLIIGNVGGKPRVHRGGSGKTTYACAQFSIAVNKHFTDAKGKKHSKVTWIDCVAWGPIAEWAGKWVNTGQGLLIDGELEQTTWKTRAGEDARKLRVVVKRALFMGEKVRRTHEEKPAEPEPAEEQEPVVEPPEELPLDDGEERLF